MKPPPITPARIAWGAPGEAPRSIEYGDVYHPHAGAPQQARHVFLQGNGLPARWAGREHFTIVETGFGLGHNFLAAWQAWRDDPARCGTLHFVSVEAHPVSAADLQRAHADSPWPEAAAALRRAWPAPTPDLHLLDFEGDRVRLLLALGDAAAMLPRLRLQADAFFLDGFAPARNPAMWQPRVLKSLAALAAPGATLATWSAASALREGLAAVGFLPRRAAGTGGKRDITLADWAPRHTPWRPPVAAAPGRDAVVVGAGLAGAAVAQALARSGWQVTVLERHAAPALEGSGNPGGLFHGTVNADDGPYARWFRAAALHARTVFAEALADGVPGQIEGLLRLITAPGGAAAAKALLQRLGLPPAYVALRSAEAASALAGVPLPQPAWHFPGGGWIAPAAWVRQALATPGVHLRTGAAVAALQRLGSDWQLCDAAGRELARAPTVVLAHGDGASALLRPLGHAPWPLRHTRGQVTHWAGSTPLRLPVAGDGYALPLRGPGLEAGLLCGATREAGTPKDGLAPELREADHHHNLERLQRLTGLQAPADTRLWQARAGWRLHSDDRLPIAGAVPLVAMPPGQRLDQARLLPREHGLFVLTALGARGLTLAPLLARLIAAMASGTPWPVSQDLADAVDPARWRVRAARMQPLRDGSTPAPAGGAAQESDQPAG